MRTRATSVPRAPGGLPTEASLAAAIEIRPDDDESFNSMLAKVAATLTSRNPWGNAPWELLIVGEPASAYSQGGFWRRRDDLSADGTTREYRVASDGWVRIAAASRLADVDRFLAAWHDPNRLRFQRATLLPVKDEQVDRLMKAFLDESVQSGYGAVRVLADAAAAEGCCVMVADETERHLPCLLVCGAPQIIETLDGALLGS
jgi:hypothetical protein